MILLPPKARRLIDSAVSRLPDEKERALWENWSRDHPGVRGRDDPEDDGTEPMPRQIVAIASDALTRMAASLDRQIVNVYNDDDEVVQLDNNLRYIRAINEIINRASD